MVIDTSDSAAGAPASSCLALFSIKNLPRNTNGSGGRSLANLLSPCSRTGATVWSMYCLEEGIVLEGELSEK